MFALGKRGSLKQADKKETKAGWLLPGIIANQNFLYIPQNGTWTFSTFFSLKKINTE